MLTVMVVLAILTPWIAPYGYEAQNLDLGATPPSAAHWLGTDIFEETCSHKFSTVDGSHWRLALSPRPWHWSSV